MGGGLMQATLGDLISSGSSRALSESKVKEHLLSLDANLVLDLLKGDLNSSDEQSLIDELNDYTKNKGICVVILDALDDLVVASVDGMDYYGRAAMDFGPDPKKNKWPQFSDKNGNKSTPDVRSQIKAGWTYQASKGNVSTDTRSIGSTTMSTAKIPIYKSDEIMIGAVAAVGRWYNVDKYGDQIQPTDEHSTDPGP